MAVSNDYKLKLKIQSSSSNPFHSFAFSFCTIIIVLNFESVGLSVNATHMPLFKRKVSFPTAFNSPNSSYHELFVDTIVSASHALHGIIYMCKPQWGCMSTQFNPAINTYVRLLPLQPHMYTDMVTVYS